MASLEEAKKCPKCREPGKQVSTKSLGRRGTMLTFECPNKACRWHGTTWIVQIRADGTIPDPDTRPRSSRLVLPTQGQIEAMEAQVIREHEQSMRPGGKEIGT